MECHTKKCDEHFFPEALHLYVAKQREVIEIAFVHDAHSTTHGVRREAHIRIREQQPISRRALIPCLQGVGFP